MTEPLSLLVVDDDEALRATVVELLEHHGHRVIAAEDGLVGLHAAREAQPDLVITDVSMPQMDGFALVSALRADPATDAIPVVYLTAKAEHADVRRGMEAGGDDYLTKPFTEAELLAAVAARVTRRASIERRAEAQIGALRRAMRSSLSHELLTPLNGILGFASLLEEGAGTIKRERLAEWGSLIRQAGERQLGLVRKVLAHADVELAAADPERVAALRAERAFGVRLAIEAVAEGVAGERGRAGDLMLSVVDADLAAPLGAIEVIVRELTENAARFSARGTAITVRGRPERDLYTLAFTDAGRGMTPQQIAAIGPFVQFDRDRLQQRGLGVGLVTARRHALLTGGTWAIESEPGRGTTVTVGLPLAPLAG